MQRRLFSLPKRGYVLHSNRYAAHEMSVRDLARAFLASSGLDLVDRCQRCGGESGAALAWAFVDMVRSRDMPPCNWPINDVIRLLERGTKRADIDPTDQRPMSAEESNPATRCSAVAQGRIGRREFRGLRTRRSRPRPRGTVT
jgi:hypothetical protein